MKINVEYLYGLADEYRRQGNTSVPTDDLRALLDALAAAEHRATRAEAQSAVRGRAVVVYRERAREAEARITAWEKQYDHDLAQADLIADQAEARVRDLAQEVKDERGACLDQMEQVRIRDARIKAVQDVLDRKLPPSARTLAAEVRRALDGEQLYPDLINRPKLTKARR